MLVGVPDIMHVLGSRDNQLGSVVEEHVVGELFVTNVVGLIVSNVPELPTVFGYNSAGTSMTVIAIEACPVPAPLVVEIL